MNRNGLSIIEKKNLINIGLHIEAIDDDGNWCESEILNIIDNKIILKFLKHKEPCNRLFDISSDKWRLITNSQKTNNFNLNNEDFKKGDCVLAKWHDGNYYLSQILDINSKTKFGTKVKEYHIIYLYDNVEEIVSHSRLKSTNNVDQKQIIEQNYKTAQINTTTNMIGKRPYRKRGMADNLESQKSNDNVFYDEKTKKFTESCKIRRLRLSQVNDKDKDIDNQDFELKDLSIKLDKADGLLENNIKLFDTPKIILQASNSNQKPNSKQRFSQRKRRSSFRKADYFYPDSVDHTLNDKNKSSNNVSQVSTPVIHEAFEEVSKSPRLCSVFSNQNISDQKDCIQSSNHSPISVSLTSTDESPKQKLKPESFQSEIEVKYDNDQIMYSCNEEGQYLCLICTNKTFRKKKLVLEHIKYYHPSDCHEFNENIQPIPKVRYSPNKRYYSSYLKNNRSTLERKKHFSKFKKTCMNRTLWNDRNNITEKIPEFRNLHLSHLSLPQTDQSDSRTDDKSGSTQKETNNIKKPSSSIVYCHRCKKSTEDGCLVQCDVCLCWSHTLCYGLNENKDNSHFWECDNCANISSNDGKKTLEWHRDRWRFHSVLENELPWMPKSASSKSQNSLKHICEMQSLLSLSQRVLEALTRHLDKLVFKGANDSNSQDDLDILKNLCVYDSIDEIPRLESLDVLNLNTDNEEIFKVTVQGNSNITNCISRNKQSNPNLSTNQSNYPFNEISFSNSTPIKTATNGHKSINTSLDGILDCDIQKLEILPKADFDALINDLNSCDDIYKKDSGEPHSENSLLDFIDDGCSSINNSTKHISPPTNLNRNMPFSQSTCLYPNREIIEQPETIYLSSDELTNLLLEKEPQKDTVSCDIYDSDRHSSSTKNKYQNRDSTLPNSCPSFENKSNEIIAPTNSFDKVKFHKSKSTEEIVKSKQPDPKLEIEFNDLNAIIQPEAANIDPSTSPVFADSEMRLNQTDSECLHWLLCKFKCVEKIVESVEATILSSDSSSSSSADPASHSESDHCRIGKYLQSLLYILKKNQCK